MSHASRARRRRSRHHVAKLGAPPGTAVYTGDTAPDEPIHVTVFDYGGDRVEELEATHTAELAGYRNTDSVSWINLDGVHQADQVQALCKAFGVHPLWIEDIVNTQGRPKAEFLEERVLVIARMNVLHEGQFRSEQVSIVLGPGWVLTFQERPGDVWEPLRRRIRSGGGRIRKMAADYLLHALLDDIVDHYFLALEAVEARVDALELQAVDPEKRMDLGVVFSFKNELADFRRAVWPMRESVAALVRAEGVPITSAVVPYFRDLYDHVVLVMDILETSRERVVGVYELHIAVMGYRLNDIMKVLTILSAIFIPMTFIAGVYGMNFDHMPELHFPYGYPMAWGLMLGTALAGTAWMYSRKWL